MPFAAGEAVASVIVIASAVILVRSSRGRERPVTGLLPGELALDGAFLYLAMTAETFPVNRPCLARRESPSSPS